ncbi:22460_t:CDS:2, partial [Gigaspora margarita]
NKIALKESVKRGFILKPHEGSELEEFSNGNSQLTANRMLRARKILSYIVEKLELDLPGGRERDEIVTEKTLIEKDEEKNEKFYKPEMWSDIAFYNNIGYHKITYMEAKWRFSNDI